MIQISDSNFINIIGRDVDFFEIEVISAMFMSRYSMFSILNCTFYNIETKNLLGTHQTSNTFYFWKPRILVKIQNTSFNFLRSYNSMIFLENIELLQKGPVIFTNIITSNVIIFSINSQVHLSNYNEFSFSEGNKCLSIRCIVLEENTLVNITASTFSTIFGLMSFSIVSSGR